MGNYQQQATKLYRSDAGGAAPTLNGNANSPAFDLRNVSDVLLTVTVAAPGGTTPGLVVGLDILDACGNWIPQVIKTTSITGAGTTVVSAGLHGLTGNQVVLTDTGRISWTVTGTGGPSFPNAQISLVGR